MFTYLFLPFDTLYNSVSWKKDSKTRQENIKLILSEWVEGGGWAAYATAIFFSRLPWAIDRFCAMPLVNIFVHHDFMHKLHIAMHFVLSPVRKSIIILRQKTGLLSQSSAIGIFFSLVTEQQFFFFSFFPHPDHPLIRIYMYFNMTRNFVLKFSRTIGFPIPLIFIFQIIHNFLYF